jgi:quercetin dioxygenase-like cupin family protein
MFRTLFPIVASAALALLLSISSAPAQEPAAAQGAKSDVILKSGTTADGELIQYPSGNSPEITSAIVTLDPGGRTALHQHPVPVFAYILEGTLTVREEGHEPRTYKRCDSFLETVGHWHQGFNESDNPVKVLAVFLGEKGEPTTVAKE